MKRLRWIGGVAAGLLIAFVVAPMLSTRMLAVADFVTRYIPSWFAPVNWALVLFLIAVCEGPLLKPKYVSLVLNVLLWGSILFFLGSWHFHPSMSPVISVLGFIELNWVIPQWEAKLNQ